jgi:hypothetical protein
MPGFIQIGAPLAMLIEDTALRDQFVANMVARTADAAEARQESLDGQIVQAIYKLLVISDEDNTPLEFRKWKDTAPILGQPCPLLCIYKLLLECEDILPARIKEHQEKRKRTWLGQQVNALGLRTERIRSQPVKKGDAEYEQKAIIFDPPALEKLLRNYSLALPGKTSVQVSTLSPKPLKNNVDRSVDTSCEPASSDEISVHSANQLSSATCGSNGHVDTKNAETGQEDNWTAPWDDDQPLH